jgi:hypothetical protein
MESPEHSDPALGRTQQGTAGPIKPSSEGLFPMLRFLDGFGRYQELTLAAATRMMGDPASELISRALESGEGE